MKLFLSYGHEAIEAVRRVQRDLAAHGHACWIDSEQIHKQPDWRRSLMDALHDCDWTVGFLTRYAMREGGVAPQELAIAQDRRCGCLTTVLLEPLDGWQVPVAVGHAQWVDMSAWASQQAQGEAVFEPWYQAKLAELLERLSPAQAQRYAAEMRGLEDWLLPAPQKADIDRHLTDFVGREWLLAKLEAWRLGQTDKRLFWLTGLPGTGKSAFAAWITATHRGNVVALNICRYDLRDRCDAARVVHTLACFVARRVQDYRSLLLRLMARLDAEKLDLLDASTLFDSLLVQPLADCFDGGRRGDRLLLVVDGLDEAVGRQGEAALHDLLGVLRRQAKLLPDWVGLLVTSRPEQPATAALGGVPMLRIDANVDDNRTDLRVYARGWLGKRGLPPAELDALLDAIDQRAEGSFIYLRLLREAVETRGHALDSTALPDGLSGMYDEWFCRQFADEAAYRDRVAPLLALILAADTPVPDAVLDAAMGWDAVTAARTLQSLGSLFERRGGGWAPFHKSLRDWLVDGEHTPARHLVAVAPGRERLMAVLWRQFVTAAGDPAAELGPFLLRELPPQLARTTAAARTELVRQAGNWDALVGRCVATVERLQASRRWADRLAWCDLSEHLALAVGPDGWNLQRWVAVERGDTLTLLGRSSDALAAYRAAMAVAERLAAADPGNADWQRGLSVSHDRIGDVLVAQGDLPGALAAYRAAMATAERLAAADPGNAEWQRDLSVSHNKIGDVLVAQGDLPGALAAYRAGMAIHERLAAADPGNAEWQRDLSVSHNNIGDVLVAQGDLPGALAAYQAAMAIRERLAAADPGNAGWQRDLSISYERIGDVLRAQGDLPGALAAYRASMAIRERLAAIDPANAGWQRDLSVSHDRIGDVLVAQGDLPGALAAYRADMAIAERLAAAGPGNAGWQRDLFVSLFRLTRLLLDAGDRAAACAAAGRLDAQARLLAERFPHDRQRDYYLRDAKTMLAQACGPAAAD